MDIKGKSPNQEDWPLIVVSGLDSESRTGLFKALGAAGLTATDLGPGLGVSRVLEANLEGIAPDLKAQGVRVTARPYRAVRLDAIAAAHQLGEWLAHHNVNGFLVLDGVAESMGKSFEPFINTLQTTIVGSVTPIIGLTVEMPALGDDVVNTLGIRAISWHGASSEARNRTLKDIVMASGNVGGEGRSTSAQIGDTAYGSSDSVLLYRPTLGDARSGGDAPDSSPGETGGRHVNSRICYRNTDDDVERSQGLQRHGSYDLLVNIGPYDSRSILKTEFPDERLPTGGLWLHIALHVVGRGKQRMMKRVYLPSDGNSFVCECDPSAGNHDCNGATRDSFARFPFETPSYGGRLTLRVSVYFRSAVVHVHEITVPLVASSLDAGHPTAASLGSAAEQLHNGSPGDAIRGETIYTLTRSFADLGAWANHRLSFLSSDKKRGNTAQVFVEGVSISPLTYEYFDEAAQEAAKRFRDALFDAHLAWTDEGWQSRYSPEEHAKDESDFLQDLLTLAKLGAALFHHLFPESDWVLIKPFMKDKASVSPVTLQFVRLEIKKMGLPWQQIYDLRMESRETLSSVFICPSVSDYGPGGQIKQGLIEAPGSCPHENDHPADKSILCPFGFWGLAHILEAPPNIGRQATLPHTIFGSQEEQVATVVAWNPALNPTEARRHLDALQASNLGINEPPVTKKSDLIDRLKPSTLDLLYFYCHGERDISPSGETADQVLVLGPDPEAFNAADVMQWPWGFQHWHDRRPLVVLNACHSGETKLATLASFVDAFIATAGASGVIATEITLEQSAAGFSMELFLKRFRDGATVGKAIRGMRWDLLSRGNLLGFAYTPYCAADLSLRSFFS